MNKSSAKSKALKETKRIPENPKVEPQAQESVPFDENAKQVAPEAETIAKEVLAGPPKVATASRFSEPKLAAVEISKHDRRPAIAALKIAKLERIPARGTLKAKDIATLPEISEGTLVDFVIHCRSIGVDLSKISWEKAAKIAKERA